MVTTISAFRVKSTAITGDSNARSIAYVLESTGTAASADLDKPDDITALNWAELNTGLFHDGMPRVGIDVQHQRDIEPEIWLVTARYQRKTTREERPGSDTNTAEFHFDLGLTTARVKRAISQKGYVHDPGNPTGPAVTLNDGVEFTGKGQPINVEFTREGGISAEGVDIQVPTSTFGLDFSMQQGVLNQLYINHIQGLIGKVNSKTFKGYKPGTVMLIGASGRQRLFGDSQISFRFEHRKGGTINQVGEGGAAIRTVPFDGFDYIWAYYGLKKGSSATRPLNMPPLTLYVSKVFESDDLNGLLPPLLVVGSAGDFVTGHTGIAVQGQAA